MRSLTHNRSRDAARRLAAARRHPGHHPPAHGGQHPQVRAAGAQPRRARRARHAHGTGRTLPGGRRRLRPQRPRLRRHPGRQDDAAQLPVRGDPGPGAGHHGRRGLRVARPVAGRGEHADPAAEPRGRRRDPAASAGQGGAADATLPDRRRRGPPGGVPRPADRAELRAPGHVHAARQQCPRGHREDVHPAAAGRGEHRDGVRRPHGGRQCRPGRARRHRRRRTATCAGDRLAARPRRGRRHRDRRRLRHPRRPAGPCRRLPAAPRALRRRRFRPGRAARMTGALLGLLLGVGLLLIWRSGSRAPKRRTDPRRPGRRQQLLAAAGLTGINAAQLLALQIGLGLLAVVVVLLTTGTVTVSLAFGVFGFVLPYAQVRRLAGKRRADLREVWPEVVDNLASAVRAGLSLPEALSALSTRGPEVLRPPFARFAADHRSSGRFGPALDRLKDDLADPVGDRIVETLRVAREVGGTDLGRLLRTLATFLREDARARAELETRQGWVVSAARLAVAAPWVVLLLLATQSTTLAAYDSPLGTGILLIGGAICALAYRLMLRIGRLPQDVRVLQ